MLNGKAFNSFNDSFKKWIDKKDININININKYK